ncbi:MAG: helix-turn-helix domain-containing protein [Candidatus Thorarchaeota archaeon]
MSGGAVKDPYYQKDPKVKKEAKRANVRGQKVRYRKDIDPEKVRRLYFERNLTQALIARKLGVSPATIRRIFKDKGWEARRSRYTDEDIRRLYIHNRLSKSEIARVLGIANSTVHRAFERNQWPTFPPPTKANPEEARKLYEKGLTHREIAEKLGVARTTIGSYLRNLGIRRRKFQSDAERQRAKREQARRQSKKVKDLRDKLFGKECKVCRADRKKRKLAIHKKDFTEHEMNALWKLSYLRTVNPNDWAALCVMCHRGVHWIYDDLKMEWQDIEKLVDLKPSNESEQKPPPRKTLQHTSKQDEILQDSNGDIDDMRKALFGDECYFCGSLPEDKTLVIHRKDGTPHEAKLLRLEKGLRRLNPEEWQALCQKHHRYVHWGMKHLGLKWEEIESAFTGNNASG